MATGRINRQIINYIDSMSKKAKQMKFVKDLKKEVETDKVTTQCVVKTVSTVGKISKTTNEFPLDRIGKLAISRYSP